MGVLVRKRGDSWWVVVHHKGQRRTRKVGDRKAAEMIAEQTRRAIAKTEGRK